MSTNVKVFVVSDLVYFNNTAVARLNPSLSICALRGFEEWLDLRPDREEKIKEELKDDVKEDVKRDIADEKAQDYTTLITELEATAKARGNLLTIDEVVAKITDYFSDD